MGTLNVKSGLSPAVWGAGVGVLLVIFVHFFTGPAVNGAGLIMPISGDFFPFLLNYMGFFFGHVSGWIIFGATIIFYLVATFSVQGSSGTEPDLTAVMRGLLMGIGTSMNGVLAYNIYGVWFGTTVGLIIGIVLFVGGFIAVFSVISQSGFYQGVIGWLCWLAPMSWPVILLGLVLLVLSLVLGLIGLAGVNFFKIGGASSANPAVAGHIADANWQTGTFFLIGGLGGNANPGKTAFNMGNVAFIHRENSYDDTGHESGHNLNLFVMGWIVHYIGAMDENFTSHGADAFTELLAESHAGRGRDELNVWA